MHGYGTGNGEVIPKYISNSDVRYAIFCIIAYHNHCACILPFRIYRYVKITYGRLYHDNLYDDNIAHH